MRLLANKHVTSGYSCASLVDLPKVSFNDSELFHGIGGSLSILIGGYGIFSI